MVYSESSCKGFKRLLRNYEFYIGLGNLKQARVALNEICVFMYDSFYSSSLNIAKRIQDESEIDNLEPDQRYQKEGIRDYFIELSWGFSTQISLIMRAAHYLINRESETASELIERLDVSLNCNDGYNKRN